MRGKSFVAFGVAAVATAAVLLTCARQVGRSTGNGQLRADGWGAVSIGMSRRDVEDALHETLSVDNSASGSDDCYSAWVDASDHPKPPVLLTFVNARLAVIGLKDRSISTDLGIRIGDPEAKVLAAYGSQFKREAAPYYNEKDPQHQLYLWNASKRGLLFWIDEHGMVERIEAGTEKLKAMEGCA